MVEGEAIKTIFEIMKRVVRAIDKKGKYPSDSEIYKLAQGYFGINVKKQVAHTKNKIANETDIRDFLKSNGVI